MGERAAQDCSKPAKRWLPALRRALPERCWDRGLFQSRSTTTKVLFSPRSNRQCRCPLCRHAAATSSVLVVGRAERLEAFRIHPERLEAFRIHPERLEAFRIHPERLEAFRIHPLQHVRTVAN